MKKSTAFILAVIVGLVLGLLIVGVVVLSTNKQESEIVAEDIIHPIEDVKEEEGQSIEESDDVPEYMSPDYEKDVRDSFTYNVDFSDVDVYSLDTDVSFLVTEDSHDGSDGYINLCYMLTAYALNTYYNGNVDGVYTYTEADDVTLLGDTSSIYEVRVHGPKELSIVINSFDNKAVVTEIHE